MSKALLKLRLKQERRVNRTRTQVKVHNRGKKMRLVVHISNLHIYVQIVNDINGHILASASTLSLRPKDDTSIRKNYANIVNAKIIGKSIAEKGLAASINDVVFDRGGKLYHGIVAAIADSVRENGISIGKGNKITA